jgi:nucleoid-associated protein YgaU
MGAGMLVLAGCTTLTPDPVPASARETAVDAGMKGDVKALQEWRQEVRLEQENQARDFEALRKQVRELEAAFREHQQAVKVQFQDLETSREQDKNFIIADLTKKLTTIQGAMTPPPPPAGGGSKTGFEHVVKTGETLSVIAKGYKADMNAILKANNLKNANSIKVGQKLFIPDHPN